MKLLVNTGLLLMGLSLAVVFFAAMEEYQTLIAGSASDQVTVNVNVLAVISISDAADITLSPDIAGTGVADGEVTWQVFTNCSEGWKLELEASTTPAMTGSEGDFADYPEAVAGVPETWTVADADNAFGFTVSGDKAEAGYADGTNYEGFKGDQKIQIAHDTEPTAGTDTTVAFKAEVGSNHLQTSGTYSAVITATATTL